MPPRLHPSLHLEIIIRVFFTNHQQTNNMKTALISYRNNHLVTSDLATREGQSSTTPRSDLADRVALISLPQLPSLPDVPIAITNSAVENFVKEFHNAGYVSEPLRPLHGVLVGYQGHRADLNGRLMRAVRWVPPLNLEQSPNRATHRTLHIAHCTMFGCLMFDV